MGARAIDLADLAGLAGSGVLSGAAARERTMAVLPAFAPLLPQVGVQRGSVVSCQGSAAVSLALALAAGPSQEGAWVGVAGLTGLGVAAAVELGVAPERLVMVAEPAQGFDDGRWAEVLAAMIDGFDVVLLGPDAQFVRSGTARRLLARLQSRGAVALVVGSQGAGVAGGGGVPGPFGADLQFQATDTQWQGLGDGHGVAGGRRALVQVGGRRVPRPRRAHLWLPAADGQVRAVTDAVHTDAVQVDTVQVDTVQVDTVQVDMAVDHAAAPVVALRRTG